MDAQSEKEISVTDFEAADPVSTHVATLIDLSHQFFKPTEAVLTSSRILAEKKRIMPLAQVVEDRYLSDRSKIKENPLLLDSFRQHNSEVVETAQFYAHLFGLPEDQQLSAASAAALHDIAKADPAPSVVPDGLKSDFTLLMHPENGAILAESLLTDHPEWIDVIGQVNVKDVIQAIRCHSGPIPGFMQDRLDYFNKHSDNPIKLADIDPSHTPSLVLLASDMLALGSPAGVRKIIQLREQIPHFRIEDITKTIDDQRSSTYEVRIDSALKSAYDGAAMVRDLMAQNPTLKNYAENNYRLMTAYFQRTKSELLAA